MKAVWIQKVWLSLAALALLAACSAQGGGEQAKATLIAMNTAVVQTATAAAQQDQKGSSQPAAQAEATATNQAIIATATAQATGMGEEDVAEATLAAPIVAELPQYKLAKTGGQVGWVHDPFTLEITGYRQFTYKNDHPTVTAADFALAADITWDTQYGSSGCGYMFRSDGNKNKPNQYMLIATRFGSGHVIFTALADGEIANLHDFYPKSEDSSFQWENGTTNRLAVVAKGPLIEIYTNGVKIGQVNTTDPPMRLPGPVKPIPPADTTNIDVMNAYQSQIKEYEQIIQQSESSYQVALKNYSTRKADFKDGLLAMIAATESGRTVCTFKNAWLWLMNP